MRIKLDENLEQSVVSLLMEAGYAADRVTDENLSGALDEIIWQQVCAENRFFVTLDLDFADVRRYAPGTHPGILLLRPRNMGRTAALEVLARVIREYDLATLCGCLAVADENHTRIRRTTGSS